MNQLIYSLISCYIALKKVTQTYMNQTELNQ